ncbi:MAG: hypothetical protein HZC38_16070 [Chloroflexi bacterium]|nr:hypothetical protein [Chloroflexota bacterium]
MTDKPANESFEEFKNSFSYGSRSDMNFKFLKNLSDEDASGFFRDLLWKLGEAIDDGDFERVAEHIFQTQALAYAGPSRFIYETGPFTPLTKPLSELRLALFTSSGHFVEGDDPKPFGVENLTQQEAEARINDFLKEEPQLSVIPMDTSEDKLRVRHGGYDVRGARADPNVNFPITRLKELQREGHLSQLHSLAYSFVGACAQLRLLNHTGPDWARLLKEQQIEAVLLVPV